VLPKAIGGADIALLSARLAVREALHGLTDGTTRIIAIATESARAIFGLGAYAKSSARLAGLAWGAEDLAADIGALENRDAAGWIPPCALARSLCLFAAAAAGTIAIDTIYADYRDLDGLRRESEAGARDGFSGKLAIHPDQVPVINEAFTPSAEAIAHAERIAAAFAGAEGAGVTSLGGLMLDRPHLRAAERLLGRAGRIRS
jgi:citrate lyase subunit beta/citryl-CoA lyase